MTIVCTHTSTCHSCVVQEWGHSRPDVERQQQNNVLTHHQGCGNLELIRGNAQRRAIVPLRGVGLVRNEDVARLFVCQRSSQEYVRRLERRQHRS
mgnify:CR=1 FL=1